MVFKHALKFILIADLPQQLLREEGLTFTEAGVIRNFTQQLWWFTPEELADL